MLGKELLERLKRAGDVSPGALNLAADLVELCELEAIRWSRRADDAIRFPEVLGEASGYLRLKANGRPIVPPEVSP